MFLSYGKKEHDGLMSCEESIVLQFGWYLSKSDFEERENIGHSYSLLFDLRLKLKNKELYLI